MKRIGFSAIIAIGVHVFLLSANFNLPWSSVELPEIPDHLTVVMVPAPMPAKQNLPAPLPPPSPELMANTEAVERLPALPEVISDSKPIPRKTTPKPKKSLKARTHSPRPQPTEPERQPVEQPQLQEKAETPVSTPQQAEPDEAATRERITVTAVQKSQQFSPDRPAIPLLKNNPPPVYPKSARRKGYQGKVILKVLVAANGSVEDIELEKSCGYGILDRTALAAVRDWQFKPGIKNGKKIKMWVKVPVRFQLK